MIMENFEEFCKRNAGFDNGIGYYMPESYSSPIMKKNYEIALEVERTYNEKFCHTNEPQIGDIVEFADDYHVYKSAKIVEGCYQKAEFGMLCVCENGGSFTDGEGFSTSGGAFRSFHKSLFKLVGTAENVVWTWGCLGMGANQGIYFPLKVRKWIIPYKSVTKASMLHIRGKFAKDSKGMSLDAVWIENFGEWFHAESFSSIKAFRAWADYVGYKYSDYGKGTFQKISPMRICRKYISRRNEKPANGKPLKVIHNAEVADAWAVTTKNAVTYFVLCDSKPRPEYGSEEYEERMKLYRKYDGNPLGV